jgi:hypothetical protein
MLRKVAYVLAILGCAVLVVKFCKTTYERIPIYLSNAGLGPTQQPGRFQEIPTNPGCPPVDEHIVDQVNFFQKDASKLDKQIADFRIEQKVDVKVLTAEPDKWMALNTYSLVFSQACGVGMDTDSGGFLILVVPSQHHVEITTPVEIWQGINYDPVYARQLGAQVYDVSDFDLHLAVANAVSLVMKYVRQHPLRIRITPKDPNKEVVSLRDDLFSYIPPYVPALSVTLKSPTGTGLPASFIKTATW